MPPQQVPYIIPDNTSLMLPATNPYDGAYTSVPLVHRYNKRSLHLQDYYLMENHGVSIKTPATAASNPSTIVFPPGEYFNWKSTRLFTLKDPPKGVDILVFEIWMSFNRNPFSFGLKDQFRTFENRKFFTYTRIICSR